MMFECSDLNAPKNAKGFVKKVSVKDVAPKKVQASFAQSQKARQWNDTSQFSEMFILQGQFTTNCLIVNIVSLIFELMMCALYNSFGPFLRHTWNSYFVSLIL